MKKIKHTLTNILILCLVTFGAFKANAQAPTITKTIGYPIGANISCYGIAYGATKYAAITYNGDVYTSADGDNWSKSASLGESLNQITFANSLFVVCGANGYIATSTDAITWTKRTTGTTNTLVDVQYLQNVFYAVGQNRTILSSSNGTAWTAVSVNVGTSTDWFNQIAYGGGKYIIMANSSTGQGPMTYQSTTAAGNSWSAIGGFGVFGNTNLNKIAYLNSQFILITSSTAIFTSSNGTSWSNISGTMTVTNPNSTTAAVGNGNYFNNVYYNAGTYYWVGYSNYNGGAYGAIFTSTNLTALTLQANPINIVANKSYYLNGKHFIAGNEGFATSSNGTAYAFPYGSFNSLAFNGTTYVGVGSPSLSGGVFSSTTFDSNTWVNRSLAGQRPLYGVVHDGTKFVAVGDKTVISSTDGSTWSSLATPTDVFACLAYGGSKYVVGGYAADYSSYFLKYSSNGTTWTTANSTSITYFKVRYVNGVFFALGIDNDYPASSGVIMRSTDGITWTNVTPTGLAFNVYVFSDVTWDGTKYHFTGADAAYAFFSISTATPTTTSSYANKATISNLPSGVVLGYTWNEGCVSYSGGKYVGSAIDVSTYETYLVYSSNGTSWTMVATNDKSVVSDIIVENSKFRMVGTGDEKITVAFAPTNTAPTFTNATNTLSVCQNATATSINSLLQITDTDASQTETFSVATAPNNGGSITAGTTVSSGTNVSPTGWSYTPANGFSGTETFTIQVSDGTVTASKTITVTVNQTTAPTASAQTFCNDATIANLVATGTALQWYAASTGGSALATTTSLATGTYYVSQTVSGCKSSRTAVAVTANTTLAPTASAQTFCSGATVANLLASPGVAARLAPVPYKWYTASTGGTALATSTALASGTYYVSQTLNSCESSRTAVAVTVNTTLAPTASAQTFCSGATVDDLVATGTELQWYTVASGGSALATATVLSSGDYFVSQTINGCESARTPIAVILTPVTENVTTLSVCGTYTWANNGQTYTTSGVYTGLTANCVTEKLNLTINVTPIPLASPNFNIAMNGSNCSSLSGLYILNGTINGKNSYDWSLSNFGKIIFDGTKWIIYWVNTSNVLFSNSTSTTGLLPPLTGWVRVACTGDITITPETQTQTFCSGATVANLDATGTDLKWYNVASEGTALATSTVLSSGDYFVSQTINGCESARTPIAVILTPLTENVTTLSVCDTYTWTNNGQTYTTSGVYTGLTANCVTEKLNLTINVTPIPLASPNFNVAMNGSNCSSLSGLYILNGTLNGKNSYDWSLSNFGKIIFDGTKWIIYWVNTSNVLFSNSTSTTGLLPPLTGWVRVACTGDLTITPETQTQTFCSGATVASLDATGTDLKWYNVASEGTALATSTVLVSGDYFVTQTIDGCESARTPIAVILTPLTENVTTLSVCDTYTWTNNGQTYTTSGVYTGLTANCVTEKLNLTITNRITPEFTAVNPICAGESLSALPTTSNNGITGTWSPALDNATTTTTTTTYTFTPTAGQCATTTTLTINVNPNVTPTFTEVAPICAGESLAALPNTSNDCISGTWSPALNNLATTTYTFIPNAGQCANITTLTITVNPIVTPIFTAVAAICSGATLSALPTTSNNAVAGTWSPALNNLATTTYTFTPATGQCGTTATMTIAVTTTPAPIALSNQSYSGAATLANLSVTGSLIQWYSGASGGSVLPASTALVDGTTYYASQTLGSCESARTAVSVNITIPSTMNFCNEARVADAVGTSTLRFYHFITGSSALAARTLLTTRTYFVTQVINGIESSPRVSVGVTLNALPARVAAITASDDNLCKYIGTTNTVTYTATPGANSYVWTVPAGVTIIGSQDTNILTVNFQAATILGAGTIGNIVVRGVNAIGCASGPERTMTLSTLLPAQPSRATLTHNGVVLTTVGNFVGDATKTLVLEATDISNTANRYTWELPAGANVVSGNATTDRIISINLGGVVAGNTDLVFKVSSVAGCGTSAARALTVTRSAPGSPRALVLTDDAISSVTPIFIVSGYTGKFKTTPLTLTATPRAGTGIEATSYKWILPSGIGIVDASAVFVSENSGFKTYTSTANAIKINLSGVGAATSLLLNVYGVNGNGESLLSQDLTLKSAVPARPGTLTSASGGTATYHPTCGTITVRVPNVFGVTYTWSVKGGAMATIPSTNTNGNEATINVSQLPSALNSSFKIGVVASNGTGSSSETIYTIKLGSACSITKIKANDDNTAKITNEFKVIAYPNPSSNVFTIKIQSLDEAKTELSVYDTAGRLVEKLQAQANEVDLGSRYPAGIYNVMVKQGENVKTVRVVKK